MIIQLIGWLAALLVLGSYWMSGRTGNTKIFDWANVIGAIILVPINLFVGASFGAFIALGFGFIAWKSIKRRKKVSQAAIIEL